MAAVAGASSGISAAGAPAAARLSAPTSCVAVAPASVVAVVAAQTVSGGVGATGVAASAGGLDPVGGLSLSLSLRLPVLQMQSQKRFLLRVMPAGRVL